MIIKTIDKDGNVRYFDDDEVIIRNYERELERGCVISGTQLIVKNPKTEGKPIEIITLEECVSIDDEVYGEMFYESDYYQGAYLMDRETGKTIEKII
ncbi:MAG: hypothetical protein ACI4OP_05450 [Candidatus Coprovivens sp.]